MNEDQVGGGGGRREEGGKESRREGREERNLETDEGLKFNIMDQ